MTLQRAPRWIVAALLAGSLGYCWTTRDRDAACAVIPDQIATSPDGRWTAISAQRGCGAVVVATELVDVVLNENAGKKWRPFEKDLAGSGAFITLRWRDASHLVVEYADKGRVLDQDAKVGDLNIEYIALPLAEQARKLGRTHD